MTIKSHSTGKAQGEDNKEGSLASTKMPEIWLAGRIDVAISRKCEGEAMLKYKGYVGHVVYAVFHRPHPKKKTDKGAVVSMRRFLENAGMKPC